MWVDHNTSSRYKDHIYVIWHNGRPAFANYRDSSGWHTPIRLSAAETTGTAIGSDITSNSAGSVFAVWPDTGSKRLFFVKSEDGGATFSSPRPIAKTLATFQISIPAFAQRSALVGVSVAAFKSGSRDDVYVSWLDLCGNPGCNTPDNEPGTDVNSTCKSRIWFTRSTDGGTTWTEPVRKINDASATSDQFNQKLAVDPETGVLGITYYDTGDGISRAKTNLMFQYSTDGGNTWSEKPTKVTEVSTDETTANADSGNQYGDYNGLSVAKGVFFPSWTDRREGKSESIFAARIGFKSSATGAIEPELLSDFKTVEQTGERNGQ
jgi:hypothetical protein